MLEGFGLTPLECPEGVLTISRRLLELGRKITEHRTAEAVIGDGVFVGANLEHALRDMVAAYASWLWGDALVALESRGWITPGRGLLHQTLGPLRDALLNIDEVLNRDAHFSAALGGKKILGAAESNVLSRFIRFRNQVLVHPRNGVSLSFADLQREAEDSVRLVSDLVARWVADGIYPRLLVPTCEVRNHVGEHSYICIEEGLREVTIVTEHQCELRRPYYCMGLNTHTLVEPVLLPRPW